MKKLLAIAATFLFVVVLSLSLLAFTEDDPKKQKTEGSKTEQCENHKDAAAGTAEAKPCCKESADKSSAGCEKSATCKHESETTAEAK